MISPPYFFKKRGCRHFCREENSWYRYYKQEEEEMAFFKVISVAYLLFLLLEGGTS